MIRRKPLLPIFFLTSTFFVHSQNIDSILQVNADKTVIQKIRIFDNLAWDHMYINYDHALQYGLAANKLAVDNELQNASGTTFNTLGVICRRSGRYEESKMYYQKSGAIWKAKGNQKELINYNLNLANVVRAQGYNDSALYYGNAGLEIALELNDSVKISAVYVGIGTTYKNMGWDATAIDYYTVGADIDQALGDTIGLSIYWSNIGDVLFKIKDYYGALDYYRQTLAVDIYNNNKLNQSITKKTIGMTFQKLGMYDSALVAYDEGLALAAQIGDEVMIGDISQSKADLLASQKNDKEAIALYDKALKIAGEYEDPILFTTSSLGLGNLYLNRNQLNLAAKHLKVSNEKAQQIGYGSGLLESYQKLADAYGKLGQSQKAFSNLQQYVLINDSLNSATTLARIAELENKYELSNKNHQIELQASVIQQNELQLQRNRAIGGGIILALIAMLGGLLWMYKRKQYKTRIAHESEKGKLKEEQIKAVINSQEKERQRFAMDLHDDFGQLISALKLNVSKMNQTKTGEEIVEKSEEILATMYDSLKNIAFDLMPQTLFAKGLEEAIDELKSQINASGSLKLEFQSFEIKDKIDDDQKVAMYRVIQELVSNIIKYANATQINISITDLGDELSLMIEDDGDGFDIDKFQNGKGNGWKNIHSRIDLMHGTIDFDTIEGRKNSTVSIEIPYSVKEAMVA